MALRIPIISTFNNSGIKQAQKQVGGLTGAFKKLGLASKLSLAGATIAITRFARQSAAAAIAEEKAVRSLSVTLKNLGLAASDKRVGEFIDKLQFATGVVEDQLRPAFQKLVTVTGQVALSQNLLNTALDVSAGTGKSLDQVVTALARAYNGNNTALGRLGINLTKAQLKVMTFEQVTGRLATTFRGQAAEAARTFGGQLAILGVAADEAKEKIGVALINAIDDLAGSEGVSGLADDMDRLATSTASTITGFGYLLSGLKQIATLGGALTGGLQKIAAFNMFEPLGVTNLGKPGLTGIADIGRRVNALSKSGTAPKLSELGEQRKAIAAGKELAAANQKAANLKKAELLAQRQLASNKKLAAKFDQDNIAIEAALKGKLSDEDRARLLALKALKTETLADDQKALDDLNAAQKLAADQELERIKQQSEARSAAITKEKQERQALQEWLKSNPMTVYTTAVVNGTAITAPGSFGIPGTNATPSAPPTNASPTGSPAPSLPAGMQYGTFGATGGITVNVNAGAIADENKLTYIIADQIVKYVRFGGTTAPAGFI